MRVQSEASVVSLEEKAETLGIGSRHKGLSHDSCFEVRISDVRSLGVIRDSASKKA